jgi:energy-coupling factor transporter ATP-binding protein EcfA2
MVASVRLLRVYLDGYKRFATSTGFTVDSDVVALVGPNEAGKTSVLQALAHLNSDGEFRGVEFARGVDRKPDDVVVEAVFQLDPDDLSALETVPEAQSVRRISFFKRYDGGLRLRWYSGRPERDLTRRREVVAALNRAAVSPALRGVVGSDERPIAGDLTSAATRLAESPSDLAEGEKDTLRELADELAPLVPDAAPMYIRGLPTDLRTLAEIESLPQPWRTAANILFDRRPRFEWFDDEARSLAESYEIRAVAKAPPKALVNLADLAGLDLAALGAATADDRRGEVQELIEQANDRLHKTFTEAWTQGTMAVRLIVEGGVLQLFVREESGTFWGLSERSDGLRWFVALVALLATRKYTTLPILLIDEAERHLHYDAQADLVRTFQSQSEVAGIIYTTHSAGCLPQDFGSGVKVVKRVDHHRSIVRNGFWVDDSGTPDEAGFSPVLMEMGASTLAFSAARFAVICEGRTDLILLPTLFRQACDWPVLPFQIVPGLASTSPYAVASLDLAAARVLFLVDRDDGGRGIERKLRRAGVPAERIFRLRSGSATRVTVEDFIEPALHKATLDQQLEERGNSQRVPMTVLRTLGRSRRLDEWFAKQSPALRPVNKAAVAHALVSRARVGEQVLDQARRNALRTVASSLMTRFEADVARS